MTTKKQKRIRGIPVQNEEVKKRPTIFLTPSTWEKAQELSKNKKISVSVFIE
ncbi:MAG: hypothetical protein F6J98_32985 [Moorea sp. SIO4G2]|uniref:hypothetical protein n=1 Tax=unclassified Moorena TaxID=2683338 RepID=UPI0013F9DAB2|nr:MULTISPECIES: hypothetical protein [unclassified Moorena]NEO16781.1 hypothetical protein [Moorena sp. SIO3E8]NEO64956.1 hypothetical protein [Moorena sp. SIO4G2]NEQ03359.1 hypothetical protein [Moorena sp. SIO3F7]